MQAQRRFPKWRVAGCLLAVLCAGGVISLYFAIFRAAMECEYRSQATWLMLPVVEQYVKETHGQWPRSWDDLKHIQGRFGGYSWPQDATEIQKRVYIDFTADIDELARTRGCERAIRPAGGGHFVYSVDYRWLHYRICLETGHVEELVRELDSAIALHGDFGELYYWRGAAYRKMGESEKAEADFKNGQKLAPAYDFEVPDFDQTQ